LVTTMGGFIEEATDAGGSAVRLNFPGACDERPD